MNLACTFRGDAIESVTAIRSHTDENKKEKEKNDKYPKFEIHNSSSNFGRDSRGIHDCFLFFFFGGGEMLKFFSQI